jgi:Putative metallopeptidase
MKKTMVIGAAFISSLLNPAFDKARAAAQEAETVRNEQIETTYGRPSDPVFQAVYERLTKLRVLEQFTQFMAPLRLPRKLVVMVDRCGAAARPYKPQGPVTVCYELLDKIERVAAKADQGARETVIVGTFIQVLLHEVAHAVFDILQVPVWGRAEDAADNFAAFVMLQFGDDLARRTIRGSTEFFLLSDRAWTGTDFAAVGSPERQRYFNYLCMAYGSDRKTFEFLVNSAPPVLPPRRAKWCNEEYETFRMFFYVRIMPYIDPDLLVAVRSKQWLIQ